MARRGARSWANVYPASSTLICSRFLKLSNPHALLSELFKFFCMRVYAPRWPHSLNTNDSYIIKKTLTSLFVNLLKQYHFTESSVSDKILSMDKPQLCDPTTDSRENGLDDKIVFGINTSIHQHPYQVNTLTAVYLFPTSEPQLKLLNWNNTKIKKWIKIRCFYLFQ